MNSARHLTPIDFARKYGADRIARLLPLFEYYGYVTLTESGAEMLAEAKRILAEPFGSQLAPADRPAALRLREWRMRIAHEEKVSAFVILTNKKLFALAEAHPATISDLSGFGISKRVIEAYSSEILAACRRDPNDETSPTVTSPVAPSATSRALPTTTQSVSHAASLPAIPELTISESIPR